MSKVKKSSEPELPPGLTVRYEHRRVVVPSGDPLSLEAMTISPRGGTTVAFLRRGIGKDPEVVAVGVALCCPRDNYRRSIGRPIALSRALKAYRDPRNAGLELGPRVGDSTAGIVAERLAEQWTPKAPGA